MTEAEAPSTLATEEALDVARPLEREKVTACDADAAIRLLHNFVVSSDTAGARKKRNSLVPFNFV